MTETKEDAAMSPVLLMNSTPRKDFELSIDEIAKERAQRLLIQALNLEVDNYRERFKSKVDKDGRRLVVRNGLSR